MKSKIVRIHEFHGYPVLLATEVVALALGGVLELEILLLLAGTFGRRVSCVTNAPQSMITEVVHSPASAAGVFRWVQSASLKRDVQAV